MKYMIKSGPTHPLKGEELELFHIDWEGGKNGKWVRKENGLRWGFKNPLSGEIVHIHPAGIGPTPKVGRITGAFTVIEVEELPEEAPVTNPFMKLVAASAEMGTPELGVIEEEE